MADRRELIQRAVVRSPYGVRLGVRTEEVRDDFVRLRLPFSEERTTVGDLVHGGAIASLIDIAATAAAWSSVERMQEHRGTTVGFTVNFLAGARGQDLVAEARVVRRGGSISVCEVQVLGSNGDAVARGLVTYKLTRADTQAPQQPAEVLASLFAGKSDEQRRALLAQLERGGAALYRQWAAAAGDARERDALLEAAEREERNAELLERSRG